MSITSDEVNFLVYRYLQESGFTHSSFVFFNESTIPRTNINGANVPPGALISLVQRGLQYKEMETHLKEDGSEVRCAAPFSLITPHVCQEVEPTEADLMEIEEECTVPEESVRVLKGHNSEVFLCSWSPDPKSSVLASGSGDSTARLWSVAAQAKGKAPTKSSVLQHTSNVAGEPNKDVTTLDWRKDGLMLATGSYDGIARIWSSKGDLQRTLQGHQGPIFSLKWNKSGEYLLSGAVDKRAIIWDAATGEAKQQFEFHTAPTLDVDWRDNTSFASCSTDKLIYICELGNDQPLKRLEGHTNEVNAVRWCPAGKLLASCSDDFTCKIWSANASTPIYDLKEHTKEIYTIQWSPTGPGSPNPDLPLRLASASFDATVKLWDPETGKCVHTLKGHSDPVYSVAFSPNGLYIASGSFDRSVRVWSVASGQLVKTYSGDGGVFEVSWNAKGTKVAACQDTSNVVVIDLGL